MAIGFFVACCHLCCAAAPRGTIGAILARQNQGRTYVRDVPTHLAAYESGIRAGDELLFIDGRDVRQLSDEELHRMLSGTIGQTVQLTLARDGGEIVRVTVARSRAEPYFYR